MKRKDRNLIFFLNRRCHVGCHSCNVSATPYKKMELTSQWLEVFFDKIPFIEFSHYIIWTGGEPFLSFESLKKGIHLADKKGYHSEILTSGYWFQKGSNILENLSLMGDFSLRISLDFEHQKKVPVAKILDLMGGALNLGIEVNFTVREIPGQSFPLEGILKKVEKHYPRYYQQNVIRSRWLHFIPHIPVQTGDVKPGGKRLSTLKSSGQKQVCKLGFKDLVIAEDGQLYPCCGLFNIPDSCQLAYGKPVQEDWDLIEKRQSMNSFFKSLREKGPYNVCLDLATENGKPDWLDYCVSPCQICVLLFHYYTDKVFQQLQL